MTVTDRITEIHPATNLLSYQSTFLQEGARNFTLKKNNHKQRKSEKQKRKNNTGFISDIRTCT